ncbi:unnamed protein product [Moneuplotes crassus]|uniref:Uncharacterized protein n=1 Tax=Euplotes crassus TaxID=5936 RepID=A0AAD1XCU8_EUPCR|nr:unnamed protein product [Moneuplotes crassus]
MIIFKRKGESGKSLKPIVVASPFVGDFYQRCFGGNKKSEVNEFQRSLLSKSTLNSTSLALNQEMSNSLSTNKKDQEECKDEPSKIKSEFIPFQILKLEEMKPHLLKTWKRDEKYNSDGTLKKSKGRKRINVLEFENLFELIHQHVIPQWKKYLVIKSVKTYKNNDQNPRSDILWKKIIRDVREFYRTLFRMRFHYLDYKDLESARKCVNILFEEIGIPIEPEYFEDPSLFTFLHQTHKGTESRLFSDPENEVWLSPFKVIEKFNSSFKKSFMSDKLCARLFYFVYANYVEEYTELINPKYKEDLSSIICLILKCYTKMTEYNQLPRVNFLSM